MVRPLSLLGSLLDKVVGVFSPAREFKRQNIRQYLERKRQYAAARVTRLTGDWMPADPGVNQVIGSSLRAVRARLRQLGRDFPFMVRALRVLVNLVVGTGMPMQAKNKAPGGKGLNQELNSQIEEAWERWCEEADVSGRLSLHEMARLAKRQELESGEFILAKVRIKRPGRFLPLALQMFEADWLTDLGAVVQGDNLVDQGVEYERNTGRVVAYHLADPTQLTAKPRRIPAEDIIHGFETLRPGQLRGISPFVSAILLAQDLREYLDTELDGAKLAARWLAFVKTPDPEHFQAIRANLDASGNKTIEELENGIIEYLRPGEDVEFKSHNRPSGAFGAFAKFVLRMLAVVTGISYELLSGDYEGLSWSTLKGVRQDLADQIKPLQAQFVRWFYRPIYDAFLDELALSGRVRMPGYFIDPRPYQRATFLPPGMESMDQLRESRANMDDMGAGLRSPQELAAKRGRDLEEIMDELKQAQEMAEARGLTLNWSQKPMKQNPAALGA